MLLIPPLYNRHRGYALVATGIALLHIICAFDEMLPGAPSRHASPVWGVHNALAPVLFWGVSHAIVFVIMVYGMYRDTHNLFLVRMGCAASISVFMMLATSFTIADYQNWPNASFTGVGFCVFVILSSVAALLEPGVNPASSKELVLPRDV